MISSPSFAVQLIAHASRAPDSTGVMGIWLGRTVQWVPVGAAGAVARRSKQADDGGFAYAGS
jgi:hypothetical protein